MHELPENSPSPPGKYSRRNIETAVKGCPLLAIVGAQLGVVMVGLSTYFLALFLYASFYSSPYSLAPNRMIAQTSLSPYMHSPVSSYQVGLYL